MSDQANEAQQAAWNAARDGNLVAAEQLYQEALRLKEEEAEGYRSFFVALLLQDMARFYAQCLDRPAESEQLYRRAAAIFEETQGLDSSHSLLCRHNLAGMCYTLGRTAEAEMLLQDSIRLYEQATVPEHWVVPHRCNLANDLSLLAHFYTEQGRYAEAEPLLQRALAIKEEAKGPEHLHVAFLLQQYGEFLQTSGRAAEGEALQARAEAIVSQPGNQGLCGVRRPRSETSSPG